MYVIFPADELISLTYGLAVPRVPPRPTLDNLREPLVPTGSRPSSTTTTTTTSAPTKHTSSTKPTSSPKAPPSSSATNAASKSNPAVPTGSRKTPQKDPAKPQGKPAAPAPAPAAAATTRGLARQPQQQDSCESYELDGPSGAQTLADSTELAAFVDDGGPRNGTIPAATGISAPASPLGSPKGSGRGGPGREQGAGAKSKSKLQLKLGRLRPHSSIDQCETASRVREDQHIHVSNPVFTRDNLRQRNFDAFFESGEQVYSLEVREKPSARALQDGTLGESGGSDPALADELGLRPAGYGYDTTTARPASLGFFRKPKSPLSVRSKSAEHEFADVEASQKESSKSHRHNIFSKRGTTPSAGPAFQALGGSMSSSGGGVLKDVGHPGLNEALKSHNSVTFKLVKTVSDFSETLAQLYEQHAEALQVLVSNYRKRNSELRKERPACQSNLFAAWETLLQEIEADSQATIDVAGTLSRQVARPLLERSFYRKVQSRKVFTHRESFDTIISKTEEKLSKCRIEYKQCYIAHRQSPSQQTLTQYIDSHNAYVQQLHATNAMLEAYHCETLPQLMQELEEIYGDLCNIVTDAVLQGAEAIAAKAAEQAKRYDGLAVQCKNVSPALDLGYFVRTLPVPANVQRIPRKAFAPPQPTNAQPTNEPGAEDLSDYGMDPMVPVFKDELVVDKGATIQVRPSLEALRRESQELEIQIKQLQDSVDALVRTQIRGIEGQLYNKANEIQEDISMKKFDVRAKQIHLAAVRAQKELFLGRIEPGSPRGERKMSSSSSSSMKTKWLKAFRSLKPAGSANDRKSGNGAQIRFDGTDNHNLQEYTYKKITPCDVCSQVLRGHTRQGLRCRICKVNVHADCAPQLPKCQVKQKLLRRQKSTSEIENRAAEVEEEKPTDVDQIYQVLKQAREISSGKLVVDASKGPAAPGTTAAGPNQPAATNPPLDIPVVKVPEYPDRGPWRGPVKSQGPNYPHQKQGLTAPVTTDMSSSAEEDDIMISTRPFGQPLCFVVEEPPPEEQQAGKKDGKRKK
uniref:Phorbol-ester/DAG-type domain-containing protein n=2 Tax=Anopheles atroparvus TaxID=41427 RepID=A0AAG5D3N8_ANOAO